MKGVIQAGGLGSRLRPYTLVLPKPLMPVGGRPVIEILLGWLRRNDVTDAHITTGYLGHLLKAVCEDGEKFNMNVQYTDEPEPLGTIGALSLIKEKLDERFLVLNGDLITDLSIRNLERSHAESGASLTVATTKKTINVDLGVLDVEDGFVTEFREKPSMDMIVSMGVYVMEPSVLELIPQSTFFGFDDLIYAMMRRNLPVNTYLHDGLWMDIGRPEDYEKANAELATRDGNVC